MTEHDKFRHARAMSEYIEVLLEFADKHEDNVLAAKLEDVRDRLSAKHLECGIDDPD